MIHEDLSQEALSGAGRAARFISIAGKRYYIAAHVVRRADDPSAVVGLAGITIPLDKFEARPLATLLTNMTITFFVLLLVAIPLFTIARRLFLSPLVTMANVARTFGETGKAPRLSIHTNDEIQQLAEAFNTAAVSRMAVQKALVAERARAEQASRAKSEFLANMSHEIRTPMNGVIGMIDLARDTPLNPEQKQYLETASSSAESLLSIINDILDFSKIEAGRLDLDSSEFALTRGIANGLAALALEADRRGVKLIIEIGSNVPESLVGDLGRLRQIVVNLVGNAIKFTEKGEVALRVEVDSRTDTHVTLHFAVEDTGIGIRQDKQALIFDAFSQADGSTTRQFGGTGLGLSISSKLVSMMQGRIWVESEPGVGSIFHFTAAFGIGKRSPWADNNPHVSLKSGRPLRILLAEDNAVNQCVASSLLERRGHTVVCATNGVQALAMLDDSIDIVLMDIQMPEMGGFEAAAAIRQREVMTGRRVPIVALTARAMKGDREECLAAGMDDYVSKPLRPADLYGAITRNLDRSRAASCTEAHHEPDENERDLALLMSVVGDNSAFLSDLVSMFAAESVKMLDQIGTAIDEGDDDALESAAHTLRGSAATLAGKAASETASKLEILGRTLRSSEARPLYVQLCREVTSMNSSLEHLILRRAG